MTVVILATVQAVENTAEANTTKSAGALVCSTAQPNVKPHI
jgi:hypothetical protein